MKTTSLHVPSICIFKTILTASEDFFEIKYNVISWHLYPINVLFHNKNQCFGKKSFTAYRRLQNIYFQHTTILHKHSPQISAWKWIYSITALGMSMCMLLDPVIPTSLSLAEDDLNL